MVSPYSAGCQLKCDPAGAPQQNLKLSSTSKTTTHEPQKSIKTAKKKLNTLLYIQRKINPYECYRLPEFFVNILKLFFKKKSFSGFS